MGKGEDYPPLPAARRLAKAVALSACNGSHWAQVTAMEHGARAKRAACRLVRAMMPAAAQAARHKNQQNQNMKIEAKMGKWLCTYVCQPSPAVIEAAAKSEIASRIAGAICAKSKPAGFDAVKDRDVLSKADIENRAAVAKPITIDDVALGDWALESVVPAPETSASGAKARNEALLAILRELNPDLSDDKLAELLAAKLG